MKKGFTLVELLGVVIVLLVISLITFPLINSQINKAKDGLSSATKQIVFASAKDYMENTDNNFYDGEVYCVTIKELIISGKLEEKLIGDLDKETFIEIKVNDEELNANLVDSCSGVTLSNDKPPQINGIKDTEVLQWHKFDAKDGVTVTDNEDGVIPLNKLDVVGAETVTTTKVGTYTVTYSVTDSYGNTTTRQRKITVIPSEYIDNSGAANPNLKGKLVPVTIEDNGTVKKADTMTRWYDYDEKKWANAVILDNDIIPDISGNGNHGYLQGATRNEASVTTDGVDDYVYAGLAGHEFKDEFSIVLRVNVKKITGVDQDLFENLDNGGISLSLRNQNFMTEVYSKKQNWYVELMDSGATEINTWYTLVGTFKDNKRHLYVNGKDILGEVSFEASDLVNSNLPFILGGHPGNCDNNAHTCSAVTQLANMEFTDALIFDRALSTDEIAKEFSGKITNISNTSKMILRYELDDPIPNNTILPEEVIESYFVWIPKYRYKIFDMGNYNGLVANKPESKAQEIEISFDIEDTSDTTTTCKTPMLSGASGTCAKDKWMTHPAFLSIPSNGFWVGKFETGYKGANKTGDVQVNATELGKIIVKPNVSSWRNETIYNFFMSCYNFNRNLDSHMMKNTEWGAVAYLSHSKYGIGKDVNINNNSKYITGCGATPGSAESDICNNYTTALGIGASTTGNIYGVYDMSGGALEYMASYMDGNVGENSGMESIIINSSYNKYLDKYLSSSTETSYNNRILGDATGELGPFREKYSSWYADCSVYIMSSQPWVDRGGYYKDTTLAGQFHFGRWKGEATWNIGTRLILTP